MLISVHGPRLETLQSKWFFISPCRTSGINRDFMYCSQLEGYLTGTLPLTSGKLVSVVTEGGVTAFDQI